jgi:hypothetical protein
MLCTITSSTNAEGEEILLFFFFSLRKERGKEKIADGKAIGSRCPAKVFAYRPG